MTSSIRIELGRKEKLASSSWIPCRKGADMAAPEKDRRVDVLTSAGRHGWEHTTEKCGTDNEVVVDYFKSKIGEIRVVWIRTPWTSSGRYGGAIFSDFKNKRDLNLWKVSGDDKSSLLWTLKSTFVE